MSLVTPGAGQFWPHGHYLNKFGRGPHVDATYQISRLLALWFQTKRFLKFSSRKSIFGLCDLDYATERSHLNNYQRGPYKDHSCQVWSKSSK